MFVLSSEMRGRISFGKGGISCAVTAGASRRGAGSPPASERFPLPFTARRAVLAGLAGASMGFLGSNYTIRAVCIPPASLSAPGSCAVCHLEQRPEPFGLCYSPGKAAFQGARNGARCHPVGTAPRQPRGANPKGAAQQFKCHNSGAAFFNTAGLT